MYQQPEKHLSKINHGKRSRFWNNSSTNMFFESVPTNRQVATTCLFCPNIVLLWKNAAERDAEIAERNRMLKTLCLHMNIDSNVIPDECSRSMFPFCYICEELLSQLCESQETLDKAWFKIANVVSAIEMAVAKGGIFSSSTHTMRDTNQQKFTQLREMILESCRQRLEMEDEIFIRNSVGEMAHTSNDGIDDNSTRLMFPSSSDETTEKAANTPSTSIQEDQIYESPLPKMIINADLIKQEIGIETTSMERGKGEPDLDTNELKQLKRKLLFEEVEVYNCVSMKPRRSTCNVASAATLLPFQKGSTAAHNIFQQNESSHSSSSQKVTQLWGKLKILGITVASDR